MTDRTHEEMLMMTGTLDTTGIGGSPYAELTAVSHAFREDEQVVFSIAGADAVSIPLEELLDDAAPEQQAEAEAEAEQDPAPEQEAEPAPRKAASRRRGSTK
ncbi:hypothetical protein [Streptomyces sp. NPDC054838]